MTLVNVKERVRSTAETRKRVINPFQQVVVHRLEDPRLKLSLMSALNNGIRREESATGLTPKKSSKSKLLRFNSLAEPKTVEQSSIGGHPATVQAKAPQVHEK